VIATLAWREVRRALGGAAWLPAIFFLLVAAAVPFAVGPDPRLLARIGGGALWIAALTAALLPIERLVEPDRAAGWFDQLALRGMEMEEVALAKIAGHWLTFGPLLLLATLPAAALLGMDAPTLGRTALTLAIGTPALAALAVAVASLTAGLSGASALGGLLMLPLAVPVLIFGAAAAGDGGAGALRLQAAAALFMLVVSPLAAGAALRAQRT
jgi:heme exporter protein B